MDLAKMLYLFSSKEIPISINHWTQKKSFFELKAGVNEKVAASWRPIRKIAVNKFESTKHTLRNLQITREMYLLYANTDE